jgi:hypothetical protein
MSKKDMKESCEKFRSRSNNSKKDGDDNIYTVVKQRYNIKKGHDDEGVQTCFKA